METETETCTSEYHVPTHIIEQPYGGWYLFCSCQEERCGNIQFQDSNRAARFAEDLGAWAQPCLFASAR